MAYGMVCSIRQTSKNHSTILIEISHNLLFELKIVDQVKGNIGKWDEQSTQNHDQKEWEMRSSLFKAKVFFYLKLYEIWNEFTLSTSVEMEPVNIDWFVFYFFIRTRSSKGENNDINGDNREKHKDFNLEFM